MLDEAAAEQGREQQRAVYSSGDTHHLARQQEPLAMALVEAAAVQPGERIVDIGAGTGNVAIAAARRGARVTAVDITPHQVRLGAQRSLDEGLEIEWTVADAEDLPVADQSVDVVLSSFGVVYAAYPQRAAAEITRVLKPTGRALFTAYPRNSFNGTVLELVDRYLPGAGESAVDEYLWADPEILQGWFADRRIAVSDHLHHVPPEPSLDAWWEAMRGVPILERLRDTLPDRDFEAFRDEVIALRARFADIDPDGTVHAHNRYAICRAA